MANSNTTLKAFARYDGQNKIVPGSLILREEKPTVGNFKEIGPIGSGPTPNSCDASHLNLETLLTNMNSCYEQVTNLFPTITYFTDYSDGEGITSINNGCNDMYDGGNLFNTNLTQTYNVASHDNLNFDESIPYTHTQQPDNLDPCDYTMPPMDGQIVSGTGIFNTANTTCSKYFTNMYPGMFMLAATGMNVAQFGIYGNLGSDGQSVIYNNSDLTNYPDWTVFLKVNNDNDGSEDPNVTHITLIYGSIDNVAQVVDCGGRYDDNVLVGLGAVNTAVITIVFATASGEATIGIADAVDIANKILDVYTNACIPPPPVPPVPTLITIDTTSEGSNFEVSLPYSSSGTYTGTIDWGDGTITGNSYADRAHTYVTADVYTISVLGKIEGFNHSDNDNTLSNVLTSIDDFGNQFKFGPDTGGYFYNCLNLTNLASNIPLSGITNMGGMLRGANSFNQNISSWNVSNVTNMNAMFMSAILFNQSLAGWDVSNVTDMSSMFQYATAFNGDVSNWQPGSLSNMSYMFAYASSFNPSEVGEFYWNVSPSNTSYTFYAATSFNSPLSSWGMSVVTNMNAMFTDAISFNQDISGWDVSRAQTMVSMFAGATSFNQPLSTWDVSSVSDMSYMFQLATSFDQDLYNWPVGNVINANNFLLNATGFSSANLGQIYNGWSALSYLHNDVVFGAPNTCYPDDAYTIANRQLLIDTYNWTINDAGVCPTTTTTTTTI